MRNVTKKEGEEAYRRLLDWANSGENPSGGRLDGWLYQLNSGEQDLRSESEKIIESLTPKALQKSWKTPSEFPNCPPVCLML